MGRSVAEDPYVCYTARNPPFREGENADAEMGAQDWPGASYEPRAGIERRAMMATVFISHLGDEADLAETVEFHLNKAFNGKVDVFLAESMPAGKPWPDTLRRSLDDAAALIVLCSPRSILRPWVNIEVGVAWYKKTPIMPVCHSGLKPDALAAPLAQFSALTLDRGTPDAMKESCVQLVRAVQTATGAPSIIDSYLRAVETATRERSVKTPAPLREMVQDIENTLAELQLLDTYYRECWEAADTVCLDWRTHHATSALRRHAFGDLLPRTFQGTVLSPHHLHVAADRLTQMLDREGPPRLLVGLNEGGMIMTGILLASFPHVKIGVIATSTTGRRKKVDLFSLPKVPDVLEPEDYILVVDAKLKTGASLLAAQKALGNKFPRNKIRFAIAVAYHRKDTFRQSRSDPPWLATFKPANAKCYVVFYKDWDGRGNPVKEIIRRGASTHRRT